MINDQTLHMDYYSVQPHGILVVIQGGSSSSATADSSDAGATIQQCLPPKRTASTAIGILVKKVPKRSFYAYFIIKEFFLASERLR